MSRMMMMRMAVIRSVLGVHSAMRVDAFSAQMVPAMSMGIVVLRMVDPKPEKSDAHA